MATTDSYNMFILFGIGNPGKEYAGTRHNVGVSFLEWGGLDFEVSEGFVNTSGLTVKKILAKKHIAPDHLIVTHDDLDITFGKIKVSFGKDAGGHKGVQSIIDHLGTNQFWRLRFGIANDSLPPLRRQAIEAKQEAVGGFVLSKFAPAERERLLDVFELGLVALKKLIA